MTVEPAATKRVLGDATGAIRFALQPMKARSPTVRAVLLIAVVVHRDRAAAEAGARADVGVADVGEVVGLHAAAELAVLDLDEVPDADAAAAAACRAAGARSGRRTHVVAELARLDHAVRLHVHAARRCASEPLITQPGSITVSRPISTSVSIQVDAGIDEGDAGGHQLRSALRRRSTAAARASSARVVDAERLVAVVESQRLDASAVARRAIATTSVR